MKLFVACILLSVIGLQSCTKSEPLIDTKKITYRVTGTAFEVTYLKADGTTETVYNQVDSWKEDLFAPVGEPVYLMARGSEDLVIKVVIAHEGDTVRKAKDVDGDLVFITYVLE